VEDGGEIGLAADGVGIETQGGSTLASNGLFKGQGTKEPRYSLNGVLAMATRGRKWLTLAIRGEER